ncbi:MULTISPECIES: hypothetical protein [Methylocaldum]|jgi:hypothetical protein|uniref:hypothetical protein n=2 Tax=unclassified Methylocaldum TaxID=2622260 RepID=UPI0010D1DFB9|nr:hypothetical protein [Methylocaldum sp. RMAD-M]MBP1149946.1 hypothetical protein [Methylocaldum sp. RMAD-M]MDV3242657.1 hypothetical protein [Methylocaldum sp.]MVF21147.1 hypothetical protein [Methylocaldum sp. BRCS4]
MVLEIYLWCWMHLEPRHAAKRGAKLLGLAVLVLAPLIYANVEMTGQGFKPSTPSLTIEVGQKDSNR